MRTDKIFDNLSANLCVILATWHPYHVIGFLEIVTNSVDNDSNVNNVVQYQKHLIKLLRTIK